MQKGEKVYLCLDENAKLFVSRTKFLFIPVEVDMIWWIKRFGNWYKYVHELSVEDVLKPEVHHRPDI